MADLVKAYEKDNNDSQVRFLLKAFKTILKIENGIPRWTTNNSIIPRDAVLLAKHLGYDINVEKTEITRRKEDDEFFERYRKQQMNRKHSHEELCEMRAAFGEGTTVVDVITGKTIKL